MTITQPDNTYPLAVENSICYGFLDTDYLLDIGRKNTAVFCFPDSEPNPNGDTIVIMGHTFTVSDASGSSSSTWNGSSNSGLINAQFFRDMLQKSFYFTDFVIELGELNSEDCVTVTSKGNTNIDGFDQIDQSGLTNPILNGAVNGIAPQYVNGYRIMFRYEYFDGSNWCPVCESWNVSPVPVGADYNPLRLDVDIHAALSRLVKTKTPNLSQSVTSLDETISARVRLQVGSQQTGVTDPIDYNEFTTTDEIIVINSALQVDGPANLSEYVYRFDTPCNFLSSRATVSKACSGDYLWFWLYGNLEEVYINEGETVNSVVYTLKTEFYNAAGLIGTSSSIISNNDGVFVIPVGPKNGLHPLTLHPTASRMDITVMGVASLAGSGDTRDLDITNTYTLHLKGDCCEDVQLFFLSPFGGYDTLSAIKKTGIDVTSEMTEICTDDPCGGDLINTGKAQVNGKSLERIVLETSEYQKTEDVRRFFRDFKISESRFILAKNDAGQDIIRRFLVEPGTLRVWQDGEKLKLSVAGTYGNELKQQSQG